MRKQITVIGLAATVVMLSSAALAAPINVLWWDSTPEYGGQAPDSLRKAMLDYIDAFGGGSVFSGTYVSSETPGTFATHMASNSYDAIVFDATSSSSKFNAADTVAIQNFYSSRQNLLLDGSLYVRSINFNAATNFPGINGGTGGLMVNQVHQLGIRGGGIMIGTDHNCCQTDANEVLKSILPSASFSGITFPSTDGVFYGSDMLNSIVPIAAADVFNHWDSIDTQAIAATGTFVNFMGNNVTLMSQVDVADEPGGGTKFSYISTSWAPGSGTTAVTDDTVGGSTGPNNTVPEPSMLALFGLGLFGVGFIRRRRRLA